MTDTNPAAPAVAEEKPDINEQLAALARALEEANAARAKSDARAEAAEARAAEADASVARAEARAAASGVANASQSSSKERFRIIISDPRDSEDLQRVYVGVNGRGYDLARGIELDVPWDVVEVLKNAVVGVTTPTIDDRTQLPAGYSVRNAARFPFQLLGRVVDANGTALEAPEPIKR